MSLLLWCLLFSQTNESLTPDEVIAIYRQNSLTAKTLKVTVESTSRRSPAALEGDVQQGKNIRRMLELPNAVPLRERADLIPQAEIFDQQSKDKAISHTVLQYLTDRQNVQIRMNTVEGLAPPWKEIISPPKFPSANLTHSTITEEFGQTQIASCGVATKGSIRSWSAAKVGGNWTGGVYTSWRAPGFSHAELPPLFLPTSDWHLECHTYDLMFQAGQNVETILVDHQVLDGVPVLFLAQYRPNELPPITVNGRRIDRIVRAWVDPARGCLPIRVELIAAGITPEEFRRAYAPVAIDADLMQTVIKNVSIIRTDNGVFYPQSLEVEGYIVGVMKDPPLNMRPEQFDAPKIVGATTQVKYHVTINPVFSDEEFALEFPEETVFVNQHTGEIMITSDRDGSAERFVIGAMQLRDPKTNMRTYWVIAAVLVALALSVFVRKRRRRPGN